MIGEAARHVSQSVRDQIPNAPWIQIIGMRHRVVHAYFEIDRSLLWEVVARDLGPLIDVLHAWEADTTEPHTM